MITKEAIEAGARGVYYVAEVIKEHDDVDGLDWEVDWGDVKGSYPATHEHCVDVATACLTAALAAMPGPAVKVKPQTDEEVQQWIEACNHEPARDTLRHYLELRRILSALTPAPDLASENERLRAALEKIAAFGDGQPSNIHDLQEQRYSARAIRIARAALERG